MKHVLKRLVLNAWSWSNMPVPSRPCMWDLEFVRSSSRWPEEGGEWEAVTLGTFVECEGEKGSSSLWRIVVEDFQVGEESDVVDIVK